MLREIETRTPSKNTSELHARLMVLAALEADEKDGISTTNTREIIKKQLFPLTNLQEK